MLISNLDADQCWSILIVDTLIRTDQFWAEILSADQNLWGREKYCPIPTRPSNQVMNSSYTPAISSCVCLISYAKTIYCPVWVPARHWWNRWTLWSSIRIRHVLVLQLTMWQVCVILVCCGVQTILLNLPFDRISDLIQNCLKLIPHFHQEFFILHRQFSVILHVVSYLKSSRELVRNGPELNMWKVISKQRCTFSELHTSTINIANARCNDSYLVESIQ